MPLYRYYVSKSPGDAAPEMEQLPSVEAASHTEAVAALRGAGRLPADGQSRWIHFLVWSDSAGKQRGFASLPLSGIGGA